MTEKPSIHYIDKKEFADLLEAWIKDRDERLVKGLPPPRVSEKIGEMLMKICKQTATRANFNGYSYLDEMIGDAIVNCLKAVNNYKVERLEKNPFGYFSRVVWNAFLARIESEKNETAKKVELFLDENYEAYTTIDGEAVGPDKNELRRFHSYGE